MTNKMDPNCTTPVIQGITDTDIIFMLAEARDRESIDKYNKSFRGRINAFFHGKKEINPIFEQYRKDGLKNLLTCPSVNFDLSSWDDSYFEGVLSIDSMFNNCPSISNLDISNDENNIN